MLELHLMFDDKLRTVKINLIIGTLYGTYQLSALRVRKIFLEWHIHFTLYI